MYKFIFIVLMLLLAQVAQGACDNIIYVNVNATGIINDGSSWDKGYINIQDALDEAEACPAVQEIWVAAGTYKPTVDISGATTSGTQNLVFNVDFDVKIYGGFCGWESELYERVIHLCPSVLSGDHNDDDIYTQDVNSVNFPSTNTQDNSYNIMRMKNLSSSAILNGFTFEGGNAAHPSTLSKQIGGAIFNDGRGLNDESYPKITHCTFQYNKAIEGGGAICNYGLGGDASPYIDACEFRYNMSLAVGGAVYNLGDPSRTERSPSFNSCLFAMNVAVGVGGAIYGEGVVSDFFTTITSHCTFVQNRGTQGPAIYLFAPSGGASPEIFVRGSIFFQNDATSGGDEFFGNNVFISASYSSYSSAVVPNSNFNINANPQFVSNTGNYRLRSSSPCINTGSDVPSLLGGGFYPPDLDGNARLIGSRSDMGAYEYLQCPSSNEIYVDQTSTLRVQGSSINNPLNSLNMALKMACDCDSAPKIHIAKGRYVPHRLLDLTVAESTKDHYFLIQCPVSILGHGDVVFTGDILDNDRRGVEEGTTRLENCDLLFSSSDVDSISLDSLTLRSANVAALSALYGSINTDSVDLWFNNLIFRDNYQKSLYIRSVSGVPMEVDITECDFKNNLFTGFRSTEGCIEVESSGYVNTNIRDCEFTNNELGGMYFELADSSMTQISRCLFSENESYIGAGIEIDNRIDETSYYKVDNCVFIDNMAEQSGAAIYIRRSQDTHVDISSSTFYNNYTDALVKGAIDVFEANGSATVRNCVFWLNTNRRGESSITGDADVSYCSYGELTCAVSSSTRCGDAMLYDTDPQFVSLGGTGGGDLRLKATSPVINKGARREDAMYFILSFDFKLNRRFVDRVDLGAYEYQTSDCPTDITNPVILLGQENSVSLQASSLIELSSDYTTPTGGVLFLDASNIVIDPLWTVEAGAVIELDVAGCNN